MEIEARLLDGADVVELSGKVSSNDYLELRETFVGKINEGRTRFILSLRKAATMDSMLLGELVACYKRALEQGGDVKLVIAPEGMAHAMLQLTGLDHIFQVYGDEREAAASFDC